LKLSFVFPELLVEPRSVGTEVLDPVLVFEDPVFEDPVFEDPVFEDPVFEDPVFDDPVFDDPVFEDPVFEDPVFEDPVFEPLLSFLCVFGDDGGVDSGL
jgi:hypothetical protein